MKSAILAAALVSFSGVAKAQTYALVQSFSGSTFFNGWQFYGNYDNTTEGDVTYVNQTNATDLAYVNSAGNVIVKVDNSTFVPYDQKRNSVRIETNDYFPVGSVFVMDAVHMPYGCSVWPSFWTKAAQWPAGGEIDIIEGINQMSANQMALHTNEGCNVSTTAPMSGQLTENNCNSTAGCTVTEQQPNSYGAGFASAGGGVFAALFESTGIAIWFWTRASVPSAISSATDSIDVSSFGTPSANYTGGTCSINEYFEPQQIVLDITLCGNWAGVASIYDETCPVPGGANATSCYITNVINNGSSALSDAYFEIAYVKTFVANGTVITPSGTASGTGASVGIPSATGSAGSSSGGGKSNGAAALGVGVWNTLGVVVLGALAGWSLL